MFSKRLNLILADDDHDDILFFKEVLEELGIYANVITVNDGVQLMNLLTNEISEIPNALFLDLNMPRKNGFECLFEIKQIKRLNHLPVIIFTTSLNEEIVRLVYKNNASYYIRKPNEFSKLKKIIFKALSLLNENDGSQPAFENFIITV